MILPLLLIPLCIHLNSKANKLEHFFNQLYRQGRINAQEYFRAIGKTPPSFLANGMQPPPQGTPYVPPQGAPDVPPRGPQGAPVPPYMQPQFIPNTPPQGMQGAPVQPNIQPQPAQNIPLQGMQGTQGVPVQPNVQPQPAQNIPLQGMQGTQGVPVQPNIQPQPAMNVPPQGMPVQPNMQPGFAQRPGYQGMVPPQGVPYTPPHEETKISSSSVMLTVGVILVSIAGLVFATALWASLGGPGRTGIIGIAAVFFFIISLFSYKKLGIKDSSNAFYTLGSVFTVITYLTAGYYELFGEALSFDGVHQWLFIGGASAIVSALAYKGYSLYKKKYLAVMSLAGGFAAYLLIARDISGSSISVFSLLGSVGLSACLAAVIYIAKGKPDWVCDTLKVCAGISGVISVLSPFVYNIGDWAAADYFTAIILFAIISLYAFKRDSKPMQAFHSVYMLAVTLSVVLQIFGEDGSELDKLTAAFFAFICMGLIYRAFAALRTSVSDNIFSIASGLTLILMADLSDNSILPFVCSVFMIGYFCIYALDKKPYSPIYAVLAPLTVAYMGACLDSYLTYVQDVSTGGYMIILVSVIYSAAALGLTALSKAPRKVDLHYISGAFLVAAALCTFALVDVSGASVAQRALALAAGIFALVAVFRGKIQPLTAVPAFMCTVLVALCGQSMTPDSHYAGKLIGSIAAYAAFVVLSKIYYPKMVYFYEPRALTPEEQARMVYMQGSPMQRMNPVKTRSFRIDVFIFGAASAVLQLFAISADYVLYANKRAVDFGMIAPDRIEFAVPLLSWVCLTLLIVMLIREKNPKTANTVFAVGASITSLGVCDSLISFINKYISDNHGLGLLVSSGIVFVCLCILSRLIFSEMLYTKKQDAVVPDFFAISALAALRRLFLIADNGSGQPYFQTKLFVFFLAVGFYAFMLIRKKSSELQNAVFRLASAGALLVAFIERPFLVSDQETVELKVTVVAITIFGFAAKYILKKNKMAAENFATAVHVFAMVLLIGDALVHQSLANTLIVMSVATCVMIVSFIIKRKRWFLISSCMLVGLTIYICQEFLSDLSWWVYLLVIGITLIAIAVTNEYLKNRNDPQQGSEKKGRLFEEWKW